MSNDNKDQIHQLLELIRSAVQKDQALRDQYNIGEKFRFIRDRLNAILSHVEENIASLQAVEQKNLQEVGADETIVYVYLYNAQGLILKTWQKMLNPAVFYEYSV